MWTRIARSALVPLTTFAVFSAVAVLAPATADAAPARPDAFHVEKQLPLAANGVARIVSDAGSVTVRGGDVTEAVAVIRSERGDFEQKYAVRFETPAPDKVAIVVESRSKGLFNFGWDGGGGRTTVEVTLPRGAGAEIESSGGAIEVSDLAGAVRAESSGGGIQAANLGGAAQLESSGGSIRVDEIGGDLDASSSGGGVKVHGAGGHVRADSSGGAVSVTFAAGNGKGGELGSSGGGVHATVDPAVGLELDASSSGGNVDCDLPLTVSGKIRHDVVRGTVNGGGALLKLRSSGGGISISPL